MSTNNRKAKRDKKFRGLEKTVQYTPRDNGVKPSRTVAEMNDYCPKGYTKCGHPKQEFEWDCFGRYQNCKYYKR